MIDPEGGAIEVARARERLLDARVLVQLGWLSEAEGEVAAVLDVHPEDDDALGLFAKIKHIRGRLSEAIACWAQVQARSPLRETARMHLLSMLHLAQDPERGAGEFLLAGEFQLVRKPAAYMELEEAFHEFVARRPLRARAHCARVAARYRAKDGELYKLAVLARSWLCELSGDLETACRLLEDLGRERGFETDLDRVLALLSLYERLGGRERLQAAVNICRFLQTQGGGGASIVGRLANLHRRLGDTERARECAERHVEAFRRAIFRPTPAEVLRVAAARYVPLVELRSLGLGAEPPPPAAGRRGRALAWALAGDLAAARTELEAGSAPVDRKYLGDVAALADDPRTAAECYVEAWRADPDDWRPIGQLLDLAGEEPPEPLTRLVEDATAAARIGRALEDVLRDDPKSPQLWRRLATFVGLRPDTDPADRVRILGSADRGAPAPERPVGRVLAGAVYHFLGRGKGLIHEIWAGREARSPGAGGHLPADHILGNLTPDMKESVRNTFLAVREYARVRFPHMTQDIFDFDYNYKVTKEDEPSGGTSAGLPTALAFLSVFLGRAVAQDVGFTGPVVSDAHDVLIVQRAGEIDFKVAGACERELRLMVVPAANRADLAGSSLVPGEVAREVVRYAGDLDEAVPWAFREPLLL